MPIGKITRWMPERIAVSTFSFLPSIGNTSPASVASLGHRDIVRAGSPV